MFPLGPIPIAILATFLFAFVFFCITIPHEWAKRRRAKLAPLRRFIRNPILIPNPEHVWESRATFNPGAFEDSAGRVHLLYRAIGEDGVSRIGYARSDDGVRFRPDSPYPVFSMQAPRRGITLADKRHDLRLYPSGGSWGGSEDPRIVLIDGRIYVTMNAFDGWDFIRIGVISIDEQDFLAKRWRWSKPLLISPEKEINKNWVIFPEKFGGRFAILSSVTPDVQVDYVDRLEDLAEGRQKIRSRFSNESRRGWDTFRRGIGPPPLKTDKGWLVLYHAIDKRDPSRYKLGALLLDLADPRKVIGRAHEPLLVPDMWYENDWKPGIVYACGAVVKDGTLYVYYGGGDKYVCVAGAPLEKILSMLLPV